MPPTMRCPVCGAPVMDPAASDVVCVGSVTHVSGMVNGVLTRKLPKPAPVTAVVTQEPQVEDAPTEDEKPSGAPTTKKKMF